MSIRDTKKIPIHPKQAYALLYFSDAIGVAGASDDVSPNTPTADGI